MRTYLPFYFLVVAGLSAFTVLIGIPGVESLPMWLFSLFTLSLSGLFYFRSRKREHPLVAGAYNEVHSKSTYQEPAKRKKAA